MRDNIIIGLVGTASFIIASALTAGAIGGTYTAIVAPERLPLKWKSFGYGMTSSQDSLKRQALTISDS